MKAVVLALTLLSSSGTTAPAENPFTHPGEPIEIGQSRQIHSRSLGDSRRINVMLPPGYDDPKAASARYPVLYLLDGGVEWQDFLHVAGLVHQGGLWGGNQPVILVGVESKDRRREFTSPSADPKEKKDFPTHGGADAFRRFLVEELKPAIDSAYRTNGVDGLMGESFAGLFVLETALRYGDDFDRYAAVSPSLWWNNQALARESASLLAKPKQPPRVLWLAMADEGGEMQAGMDQVVAALKAHKRDAISWTYVPFPQERHNTVYHPAATQAVRSLFPPPLAAK